MRKAQEGYIYSKQEERIHLIFVPDSLKYTTKEYIDYEDG